MTGVSQVDPALGTVTVLTSVIDGVQVVIEAKHVVRVDIAEEVTAEGAATSRLDMAEILGVRAPSGQSPRRCLRVGDAHLHCDLLVGTRISVARVAPSAVQPLPAFIGALGRSLGLEGVLAAGSRFGFVVSTDHLLTDAMKTPKEGNGG